MPTEDDLERIDELQQQIASLTDELAEARAYVVRWTEANADLSAWAQSERAKHQGAGQGIGGMLLGPKYRGAARRVAAQENAQLARKVAAKRAEFAEGKRQAQERVRQIQAGLTNAKQELRGLQVSTRAKQPTGATAAKAAGDSLSLLQKLKDAKDAGLLTPEEYEEKRKKLVDAL